MKRPFRPVLVSIVSCLVGMGVGVVAQIIHQLNHERYIRSVAEEFASNGWGSPPQIADILKPTALPMLFTLTFGLLGIVSYLVYYLFVTRRSDET